MNVFIAEIQGQLAVLDEEESWHCCKVLRNRVGDKVSLIDGKGLFFEAILEIVNEKCCKAKIIGSGREQAKRGYFIQLAIAPTKSIDRTEWLLEKLVEIGIDEISFLHCERSERKALNMVRLKKIVASAVKQSLQSRIPVLNDLIDFKSYCNSLKGKQSFIAHCEQGLKMDIREIDFRGKQNAFLIGPEGDFSPEEIDWAYKHGIQALSLGQNRLRTETAGLFVAQAALLLG